MKVKKRGLLARDALKKLDKAFPGAKLTLMNRVLLKEYNISSCSKCIIGTVSLKECVACSLLDRIEELNNAKNRL